MKTGDIIKFIFSFFFVVSIIYITSCDSGSLSTAYTNPPAENPYGEGNGKITFIRTQQIAGPVTIKISNKTLNDSLVWQSTPPCDTNISASQILKAGSYSVKIEGDIFMCNYAVSVEERKCKILDYTNCSSGSTGCTDITGAWLRTSDGPCPNCKGLKVEFRNGTGEVIFTPPGCRFPIGDIKWNSFNLDNCTMNDLARDSLGGSPEFQPASLVFENKNSFVINGPSGNIPYSRISQKNDKKISENIKRNTSSTPVPVSTGLQTAR